MEQQNSQDNLEYRRDILTLASLYHIERGARVITRNDQECWVVVGYPEKPVNHNLHGCLTIILFHWVIVWLIASLKGPKRGQRIRITILPSLEVHEENVVLDNSGNWRAVG